MKQLIMVVMVAMFATGCASIGDVEALQSQVSALESNDKVVASEISALKSKTNALEAKQADFDKHLKTIESKLDKVFKKSQYK